MFYALLRCPLCKAQPSTAQGCCASCAQRLGQLEPRLGPESVTLGAYEGLLERAVRAYKFHHVTRLDYLFAPLLARAIQQVGWQPDLITAVPLHPKRQRERGYNQSERLARRLAKQLQLPYATLLKRYKATRQQARLSVVERHANVENAFLALEPCSKQVLLVDDVMTSGATTAACKRSLRAAGAKQVWVAALAHASIKQRPGHL